MKIFVACFCFILKDVFSFGTVEELSFVKSKKEIFARKRKSFLSQLHLDHSDRVAIPVKYRIIKVESFPPIKFEIIHNNKIIIDAINELNRPLKIPLVKDLDGKCLDSTEIYDDEEQSKYFCIHKFAPYIFATEFLPATSVSYLKRFQLEIIARDNNLRTTQTRVNINHVTSCFPMTELYGELKESCTNKLERFSLNKTNYYHNFPPNLTITNIRFLEFGYSDGNYEIILKVNKRTFTQRFEYCANGCNFRTLESVLPRIYPNYTAVFFQKYIRTGNSNSSIFVSIKFLKTGEIFENVTIELYGYMKRTNQTEECMRSYKLWEKGYLQLMQSGRNIECAQDNHMFYPRFMKTSFHLRLKKETALPLFKQTITLTCALRSSENMTHVKWYKNNQLLSTTTTKQLNIRFNNSSDNSNIFCMTMLRGIEVRSNRLQIWFADLITTTIDIILSEEVYSKTLKLYSIEQLRVSLIDKIKNRIKKVTKNVMKIDPNFSTKRKSGQVIHTITLSTHVNDTLLSKPDFYEQLGDIKSLLTPQPFESCTITVADKDFCLPSITGYHSSYGFFYWNATKANSHQKQTCNHGKQSTKRVCRRRHDMRAVWKRPDLSKCEFIYKNTEELKNVLENLSNNSASETSSKIKGLTENSTKLSIEDITLTASILEGLANKENIMSNETWTNVMLTASQLMKSNQSTLSVVRTTTDTVNSIVESMEKISNHIEILSSSITLSTNNLAAIIHQQNSNSYDGLTINLSTNKNRSQPRFDVSRESSENDMFIKVPKNIFSVLQANSTNINSIYFTDPSFFSKTTFLNGRKNKLTSGILSVTLGDARHLNLTENIEWRLRIYDNAKSSSYKCVYWDTQGSHGDWSTSGCNVSKIENQLITCSCNHVTSFAVLFDPTLLENEHVYISPANQFALSLITYIGCAFSIACVVFTMLTILIFRSLRENKPSQVVLGLCFALGMLMIIFVALVDRTRPKILCTVSSAAIQYFLLSLFCWMFFEAITLYLKVVKVMGEYGGYFILKACLFSFGVPGIVVAVFMLLNINEYGNSQRCTVTGNAFRYGTFTPLALILVFNFVIFIKVVVSLCNRHSIAKLGNSLELRRQVRISLSCCFLLGLTWIFGVMAISDAHVTFQYLFTVTNSLQGLFICYFNALRQERVREAWKNLLLNGKIEFDLSVTSSTFRTKTSSPSTNKDSSYTKSVYTHKFNKSIDWTYRTDSLNKRSDSLSVDRSSYNSEIAFSSFVDRPYVGSLDSSRS